MARLESVAVGGYFPTPGHLIEPIADVLDTTDLHECRIGDPCAGEGAAVTSLARLMGVRPQFYLCELEAQRHAALLVTLKEAHEHNHNVAFGDAFRLEFSGGLGLLYLNPPYDLDPVHGRLEQRFLDRFTAALADDGMLVFVVPHYALAASAVTLATHYDDLACYRFPAEDFATYKQVVLFARKTDKRLMPDSQIVAQVEAWAASAMAMPVLGTETKRYTASGGSYMGPKSWVLCEMDVLGLLKKARPWRTTGKTGTTVPVPHVLPEVPVADLMFRTFPVATAPRPAHIAAGIASGLFNGRRVSSESKKMPDLLVKGVFDREYVTVEEKENKDGDVTALVQVQQPKLVTTVLDLSTKRYSTLKAAGKSTDIENLSIEGLLEHYGPSLLQVMSEQCPVIYDPQRDATRIMLAQVSRKLFTAQSHAARAIVGLLGGADCHPSERRNKAAILLGEIGSGKTTVALTAGKTVGRNMLVMCPPHLLKSWTNETLAVIPNAEIRLLQDVADVDALVDVPADKFLVAILSRETGKLGHGWVSVTGSCPKCGAALPEGDLAKRRQCCEAKTLILGDPLAESARALALKLSGCLPGESRVRALLPSRAFQKYLDLVEARADKEIWEGFDQAWVADTLTRVGENLGGEIRNKLFTLLLLADYSEERIEYVVRKLVADKAYYHTDFARTLTLLLPPGCEIQKELRSNKVFTESYWHSFEDKAVETAKSDDGYRSQLGIIKWAGDKLTLDGMEVGSLALAKEILAKLSAVGVFKYTEECGEPLFQAVPEPRRFPLSRYIANRHPDLFDLLVLDEGHEYATDGSAQERAAHRLTALGLPTILMTGSIMNGYAASLFTNMWALSPGFRDEFAREERPSFIDRYGYHKRVVSVKDAEEANNVIEFGAVTDRVEKSARITGEAPGILPLFIFRHLLTISVTLHKADLAVELPPCRQIKQLIKPSEALGKSYRALEQALVTQIRKDKFKAGYAGKLFGALAELPSYLDRASCDTGNQDDGSYEIRYPKSLKHTLVARGESFPADTLSAKEEWMLETIKAELAEGRNVMVFSWHVCLLPRLQRLIEQATGETVPILHSEKVAPIKRQDWIDKNVVHKGRRVLLANPVAIQTGLNNLVHFSSQIWMENPACNPTIFRQGIGRVDRIGQVKETRIYIPVYEGTLQVQLHDLLLRKVAVAISTDGLDPESALIAAGVASEGFLSGLSLGKQLWAMLQAA